MTINPGFTQFEEGVEYTDHHVFAQIMSHDGAFNGGILMVRVDDDTSWGEVRQAWAYSIISPVGKCLGRSKNTYQHMKSGSHANPHPIKMLGSLLHFLAAGVEAEKRPHSENKGIFNKKVTEWADQMESELASLDLSITYSEEQGLLDSWPEPNTVDVAYELLQVLTGEWQTLDELVKAQNMLDGYQLGKGAARARLDRMVADGTIEESETAARTRVWRRA